MKYLWVLGGVLAGLADYFIFQADLGPELGLLLLVGGGLLWRPAWVFLPCLAALLFLPLWADSYLWARLLLLGACLQQALSRPPSHSELLGGALLGAGLGYVGSFPDLITPLKGETAPFAALYLLGQSGILLLSGFCGVYLWRGKRPQVWGAFFRADGLMWLIYLVGLLGVLLRPVMLNHPSADAWFVAILWTASLLTLLSWERDWAALPLRLGLRAWGFWVAAWLLLMCCVALFHYIVYFDEINTYYKARVMAEGGARLYEYEGFWQTYMPLTYYLPMLGDALFGWVYIGARLVAILISLLCWGLLLRLLHRQSGRVGVVWGLAILLTSGFLIGYFSSLKYYFLPGLLLVLALYLAEYRVNAYAQAFWMPALIIFSLLVRHTPFPLLAGVWAYCALMFGWRVLLVSVLSSIFWSGVFFLPFGESLFKHILPNVFFHSASEPFPFLGVKLPYVGHVLVDYDILLVRRDIYRLLSDYPLQTLGLLCLLVSLPRWSPRKYPALTLALLMYLPAFLLHVYSLWLQPTVQVHMTQYQAYFGVLLVYMVAFGVSQIPQIKTLTLRWESLFFVFPCLVILGSSSSIYAGSIYALYQNSNDSEVRNNQAGAACVATYIQADDRIFWYGWDYGGLLYHPEWRVIKQPLDIQFNHFSVYDEVVNPELGYQIGMWDDAMGLNWLENEATVAVFFGVPPAFEATIKSLYEPVGQCEIRVMHQIYRRKSDLLP